METPSFLITGNIVSIDERMIRQGRITIMEGKIYDIEIDGPENPAMPYILPGFVDAHIHIESSMVTPPAFARLAVTHGTVATVSDPHEIANVCGLEGVRYMVDLGRKSGFTFFFGAPSCVPATPFESAGATLTVEDIRQLFAEGSCQYLSEMMNYPAVLSGDPLVMDKIKAAQEMNLPVDGHAPGLRGKDAIRYASAGITTDHECTTLEEALDKIDAGMHIIIREGSAAKNYEALHTLISTHPDRVMFCSDDKHPDDLIKGHINQLVLRSLEHGYDVFDVLKIACLNPVRHYGISVGMLGLGQAADLIVVNNLEDFNVQATWIKGECVYDGQEVILPEVDIPLINQFSIGPVTTADVALQVVNMTTNVIVAIDGSIVTEVASYIPAAGVFESDIEADILKIVVVNRYEQSPVAIGLIKGFGLKKGAIASSVAHDSHNIVAVGTCDADLVESINALVACRGGIAAVGGDDRHVVSLPVAGLMSNLNAVEVGMAYEQIDSFTKTALGSMLSAPFMTLSFMALLVIPSLKLSDKGLFDGRRFLFTPLQDQY